MATIGTVESLWRYPVKSMCGEAMSEAFMGFSGFYGDRYLRSKIQPPAKAFLPDRTRATTDATLRPQFRDPERAAKPPNLTEATSIGPGITPANGEPDDLLLDVVTPSGAVVAVDDPALIEMLGEGISEEIT